MKGQLLSNTLVTFYLFPKQIRITSKKLRKNDSTTGITMAVQYWFATDLAYFRFCFPKNSFQQLFLYIQFSCLRNHRTHKVAEKK